MNLSPALKAGFSKLPPEFQANFRRDYQRRAKSTLIAYLAWFTLGWHYLYLGRVGMQFAFWFTCGFLVVGWLIDFFRIPGMVARQNEDLALELLSQYKLISA